MNYRHAFHAGNVGDVLKHVVLVTLLDRLLAKTSPFLFLDTHAGRGLYDLDSAEARRSGEWQDGIGRLLPAIGLPAEVARYLDLVRQINNEHGSEGCRFYPGSPLLALSMLRKADRKVFMEKQPGEAARLATQTRGRRNLSVLVEDGYGGIRAQLPPRENRGLVFLDPPFEKATEFSDLGTALVSGWQRWPTGVFSVWYPLKASVAPEAFHEHIATSGLRKVLILELATRPVDSPAGLTGSGVLLVNPPWQLDNRMREVVPALHRVLSPSGAGEARVEWLVGE